MKIKKISARGNELQEFLNSKKADQMSFLDTVSAIAAQVKAEGDQAIFALTEKFDGVRLNADNFRVSSEEIDDAYEQVGDEYLDALLKAVDNLFAYHERQLRNSWMETDAAGNITGQIFSPLERVGVYVPGGTAAYPSSVLMNVIPAQTAGVREIAVVSPPGKNGRLNPYTLVAAAELGITEIYKVGGAQAIFGLAWGTDIIRPVDLISGPGNIFVTLAKKMVYGDVNIDMLAGPSEILIIADASADPKFVAADLMSQAEHDVLASSVLVTDNEALLERVEAELDRQLAGLSRRDIITRSLEQGGRMLLAADLIEACEVANQMAPEHLELMVQQPFEWLSRIKNAGAIFMGAYTPEPVGDYFAGSNHILPTGGTARFYSGVTVDTFRKSSSMVYYSREGLLQAADDIICLAEVEGLTAHANSIKVRKVNE